MTASLRALLVEDEDDHAVLLHRVARRASVDVVRRATTLSQAQRHLQHEVPVDVVLLDLNLPDSRGLDTLDVVLKTQTGVPVVVLTSLADPDLVRDALNQGAEDYLDKASLSAPSLERSLRHAVERHHLVRRIEEQAEELDRFAGAVSSDLQGPLSQINTVIAWLREDYGPMLGNHGRQHLKMLGESADQIRTLAHDLELYTQAAAGSLRAVPVRLRELVEDAIERVGEALYPRDGMLQVDPLPTALVDPEQMTRAFQVLLSLAFSDNGVVHGHVRVRGRANGLWCTVVVEHDGDAFCTRSQDDLSQPVAAHGAALSLALCRRIVEAHGGTLSTGIEPAGGSAAVLLLPRVPEDVLRAVTSIEG